MTWLLTSVQWEILATVGLVVIALVVVVTWQAGKAVMRAMDDPAFWS